MPQLRRPWARAPGALRCALAAPLTGPPEWLGWHELSGLDRFPRRCCSLLVLVLFHASCSCPLLACPSSRSTLPPRTCYSPVCVFSLADGGVDGGARATHTMACCRTTMCLFCVAMVAQMQRTVRACCPTCQKPFADDFATEVISRNRADQTTFAKGNRRSMHDQ